MKVFKFKQTDYFQILNLVSRSDRIKLFLVSLIQIFLAFLDLIGVAFFGLIGSVTVAAISSTKVAGRTESVLNFIGLENYTSQVQVVVLGLLAGALMVIKTFASLYFNKKIIFFLSRRSAIISANLTSNLFKKSFIEIKKQGSQKLIYSLTTGVDRITIGVLATSVMLVADFALLAVLLLGLIAVSTTMTLILLATLILAATVLHLAVKNKNKKAEILKARYMVDSSEKIFEAVGSYRELLLRGKRQYYAEVIGAARMSQADATANVNYLTNINKYILEASVLLITLLIAGIQFLLSNALRSVATLTLFFAAISRIAPAVFRIQQNLLNIKGALGGAKPTLDLINSLELSTNLLNNENDIEMVSIAHQGFSGRLDIKDLHFKYPGSEKYAVQGVSLQLISGKQVAVVGPSGAGKSTISGLLPRLYDVTKGSSFINGIDIRDSTILELRSLIGIVTQDSHMLHESIASNLRYAKAEASDEEMWSACNAAQIGDFIRTLPNGMETIVGERGHRLSGGEKQRLAIARLLLKQPQIVVLDEATAHLDSENEALVQEALKSALAGRTSIVIAHRLSTVVLADQILVIENGRVVESGRHDELVAKGGLYFDLYQRQSLGFAEEQNSSD